MDCWCMWKGSRPVPLLLIYWTRLILSRTANSILLPMESAYKIVFTIDIDLGVGWKRSCSKKNKIKWKERFPLQPTSEELTEGFFKQTAISYQIKIDENEIESWFKKNLQRWIMNIRRFLTSGATSSNAIKKSDFLHTMNYIINKYIRNFNFRIESKQNELNWIESKQN